MGADVYGENTSKQEVEQDEMDFNDYQNMVREEVLNWELDSEDGLIIIGDEIDETEITRLMKKVIYIRKVNPDLTKLTLIINSPGGSAHAMLAIVDYMKSLDIPVDVVCRGMAMSAAAVIFTCATGKRYMSKHSTIMYHEISSFQVGKTKDAKSGMAHTERLEEAMYKLVAEHSNKDVAFWKDVMSKDYYVSADEALELGVLDAII